MPAVVAQATVLTLILCLGVWTGCTLLIIALLPRASAYALSAAHSRLKEILAPGVPVAASMLVFFILFRTGIHTLKLVGMCVVLAAFAIACFGTCGVVQRLNAQTNKNPSIRRIGPVSLIIVAMVVAIPIALPKIGLDIILPVLFAYCAGVGARGLWLLARSREISIERYAPIGAEKATLISAGILLVAGIIPVWRAMSIEKDVQAVTMQDGAKLRATVYVPAGQPPYPVVLVQTPSYDAADTYGAATGVDHGYAVVLENTRGRYGSEGVNKPFAGLTDERPNDGWNTLEWLGDQHACAWCNGTIGTLGSYADGIAEIDADGALTDKIGAQYIAFAAPSLYQYLVYPGGILRKSDIESYINSSRFATDSLAVWLQHPRYDGYWIMRDFGDRWDRVNWPVLHIGGWFDSLSQGTLDTFVGFQTHSGDAARHKQKLIMGPWAHGIYSGAVGDLKFPDGGQPKGDIIDPWRWFDYTLKARQNGMEKLAAVTYYVMGDTSTAGAPGNVWRTADTWPPVDTAETSYYLHEGKQLSIAKPAAEPPATYAFDPKNPTPTTGGAQRSLPAGPMDQHAIESRADVLSFTSEGLYAPTEVTGHVSMKLYISSDAPDTDFFVKLCDVYPDGRSFNVCEGQLRARYRYGFIDDVLLKPGEVCPLDIDLWSTSYIFNKGHKIRVTVTSSNSPAYEVNPNTGEAAKAGGRIQIAHNSIYMDAAHPSAITLPIARQ